MKTKLFILLLSVLFSVGCNQTNRIKELQMKKDAEKLIEASQNAKGFSVLAEVDVFFKSIQSKYQGEDALKFMEILREEVILRKRQGINCGVIELLYLFDKETLELEKDNDVDTTGSGKKHKTPSKKYTDEEIDNKVKTIRENFKRINSTSKWTKVDTKSIHGQSTEGGTAKFYYSINGLEKIVATYYGETGKSIEEYYLENGKILFVFEQIYRYNRPIYWDEQRAQEHGDNEEFDMEKSEITENRYYFDKDILFQQLKGNEKKKILGIELKQEETRLKETFQKLITLSH